MVIPPTVFPSISTTDSGVASERHTHNHDYQQVLETPDVEYRGGGGGRYGGEGDW